MKHFDGFLYTLIALWKFTLKSKIWQKTSPMTVNREQHNTWHRLSHLTISNSRLAYLFTIIFSYWCTSQMIETLLTPVLDQRHQKKMRKQLLINMLSSKTTNGLEKTKRQLENLTWKRANDNVVWEYQDHQKPQFWLFLGRSDKIVG